MFGNRFFGWKLVAALAATGAMLAASYTYGRDVKPAAWHCLAEPERWDGRQVWVPGAEVVSVAPDGFTAFDGTVRLEVRGAADVKLGDSFSIVGTFRREGGGRLDLVRLRRSPARSRLRLVAELVSVAVLGLVVWNFFRRFAWRPEALRAEVRD